MESSFLCPVLAFCFSFDQVIVLFGKSNADTKQKKEDGKRKNSRTIN